MSETITVTILAVLTVAITAWVWRRWREPMLVAVAIAGEVAIFLATTLLVDRRRPPVSHLDQAPPTSSFLRLLPEPPRPIAIQRFSPRRLGLTLAVLTGTFLAVGLVVSNLDGLGLVPA